jgi:CubicO group peptidase (beta-lactamase class C family)
MSYFRVILIFLLIFLRCNTSTFTSGDINIDFPEIEIPQIPFSEDQLQHIEKEIVGMLDKSHFNGNVLVAYKGYPIVRYSNGYRHFFKKEKLNHETVFQLASVSKAFTAMAVLMLHQQQAIDIDDPLCKYIPEFPFEDITVKNLLQHTSGLQNYMYYVDNYWEKDNPLNYDDVLSLLIEHNATLSFRPGKRHYYCNTGYVMLAMLVERISGMPFYQFMKLNIFNPLDMNHTFVWNQRTMDTITNIATGFKRYKRYYTSVGHDPLDEISGDKSVYSTIDDMLKWERAWSNNLLISDSLRNCAFTKAETGKKRLHDYGMGWRFAEIDLKPVIFHNGLWNGFTTSLHRFVEDSITVIVLNNTNGKEPVLARQLYTKALKEIEAVKNLPKAEDRLLAQDSSFFMK